MALLDSAMAVRAFRVAGEKLGVLMRYEVGFKGKINAPCVVLCRAWLASLSCQCATLRSAHAWFFKPYLYPFQEQGRVCLVKPDVKRLGMSKKSGKKDGKRRDSIVGCMDRRPHVAWMVNGD